MFAKEDRADTVQNLTLKIREICRKKFQFEFVRELSEKKEMLDHMSENINDDQLDKLLGMNG